ncbi:hypothetical protein ABTM48_20320, partial [Acinetobacter baumannii]
SQTFAPGNDWVGTEGTGVGEHAVNIQYLTNTANDSVQIWTISNNGLTYTNNDQTTNIPIVSGAYAAGNLFKTITIDEQGNSTVEYKD